MLVNAASPSAAPINDLATDLVWGIRGIAKAIGRPERQTYHLVETGAIPARKIGGRLCASRSMLRRHFEALLASA